MPRNSLNMKTVFIFLLIFGIFTKYCNSQIYGNDAHKPPDGGRDGNAFFALRSCHQLLQGDSGEFSSPDYLCSNPPLWCNWTIHVEPGKRVNLFLEDLTSADTCHLKVDQIHIDEPQGISGGHGFLQKCWQEAKYTSLSNTLHVVLLIGGYPNPPYRGFYGRYQAFGPPIIYKPHDELMERDRKARREHTVTEPTLHQRGFTRFATMKDGEPMETVLLEHPTLPSQANDDMAYEYYDATPNELPAETEEPIERFYPIQREEGGIQLDEDHHQAYPSAGGLDGDVLTVMSTVMVATQGTSRSERGVTRTPRLNTTEEDFRPLSSHRQHDGVPYNVLSQRTPSASRRNVDAQTTSSPISEDNGTTQNHSTSEDNGTTQNHSTSEDDSTTQNHSTSEDDSTTQNHPDTVPSVRSPERAEDGGNGTRLHEAPDQLHSPTDAPTSDGAEGSLPHPHPNMVEPLSGNRGSGNARNYTDIPHLPGDHLFEVAVEVNFQHEPKEEHWDHVARALLTSIKALIYEQLELLNSPKTVSSKRIKRLSAGVLFILWLQIGEGPSGPHIHRALHAALQGLIETRISLGGHNRAVIVSVSTADVNECGTQLILCDINAECTNRFGSYTCRCRPGFLDMSRLGSGGTLCVDPKAAGTDPLNEAVVVASHHSPEQQHHNPGCSAGLSAELTKGVYVVFFLLSSLILLLLAAVGVLYHRHHRGAFLVPCHSPSFTNGPHGPAPDGNNNADGSFLPDSDLPPPPPPIRRPREGWSHPKDCCPAVDLPLLHFSPLVPLDGYMEPEDRVQM